jgi:hypothetical protein
MFLPFRWDREEVPVLTISTSEPPGFGYGVVPFQEAVNATAIDEDNPQVNELILPSIALSSPLYANFHLCISPHDDSEVLISIGMMRGSG